jgi:hypothetical protein
VKKTKLRGKSLAMKADVKLATAGLVKFRVVVATLGQKPATQRTTTPVTATVYDLPALTRTLFYNQTQAYNSSSKAGTDFDAANDYPSAFDIAGPSWATGVSNIVATNFRYADVPDVSTISPDPSWLLTATTCSAPATKPFAGRTFILTVQNSDSQDGYATTSAQQQLHVTLLGGKLYYYFALCQLN